MASRVLRRTGAGLLVGVGLLAASACGSDSGMTASDPVSSSTSPTESTSPTTSPAAEGPDCATIWVKGERLAAGYTGCVQDGVFVPVHKVNCSSGQSFALYDHHYWAVLGGHGLIKYAPGGLTGSNAYFRDISSCRG